jgi:hypothetical protein
LAAVVLLEGDLIDISGAASWRCCLRCPSWLEDEAKLFWPETGEPVFRIPSESAAVVLLEGDLVDKYGDAPWRWFSWIPSPDAAVVVLEGDIVIYYW